MDFPTWFADRYLKPNESRHDAVERLAREAGVSWMTIRRALRKQKLQLGTSMKLAAATAGAVDKDTLQLGGADANGDAA